MGDPHICFGPTSSGSPLPISLFAFLLGASDTPGIIYTPTASGVTNAKTPKKIKRRRGEKEVKREKNLREELEGEGTFASDSFSRCEILLFKLGFSYPATIKVNVPRLHHTRPTLRSQLSPPLSTSFYGTMANVSTPWVTCEESPD